jgi:hypothetical protein
MKDFIFIIFTSILIILINTYKSIKEKENQNQSQSQSQIKIENEIKKEKPKEINNLISLIGLQKNLIEFFKLKIKFSRNKNSSYFKLNNNNNNNNKNNNRNYIKRKKINKNKINNNNNLDKLDDYKFAKNITCTIENCRFPNNCTNENTCSCDNRFANFFENLNFEEENFNDNAYKNININTNNSNITNYRTNIHIIYCSYKRKSPVMVSIFEFIFPGAGLFYIGNYKFAIIKFNIGFIFFILIIIKIYRIFNLKIKKELIEKREKEIIRENKNKYRYKDKDKEKEKDYAIISFSDSDNDNDNAKGNNEENILVHSAFIDSFIENDRENERFIILKQNLNKEKIQIQNFSYLDYALIFIGIILLIWLIVDFVQIGLRNLPDENGVGLISFPIL